MMLSPFTLTSRSPAEQEEKTVSPWVSGELVALGCPHGCSQQGLNTARALARGKGSRGDPKASLICGNPKASLSHGDPKASITRGDPEASLSQGTPKPACPMGTPKPA